MRDQASAADRYLELVKGCLTRDLFHDESRRFVPLPRWRRWLGQRDRLVVVPFDPARRAIGKDVPTSAETMIGRARLDNLHQCIVDVLRDDVPGDLIETGVWRGGATIFMRAVLAAYGDEARNVWVADSFRGLPKPDPGKSPADADDDHWVHDQLAVSIDAVKANFARYGLLDEKVRFLEGWFADTLPAAPIDRLAVVRLDGDMYESTMDGLVNLYPRLSVGGYLIVDDYGAVKGCREAVEDYRREHDITEPVETIDWTGRFWRRQR